jgi:hypothetical protein
MCKKKREYREPRALLCFKFSLRDNSKKQLPLRHLCQRQFSHNSFRSLKPVITVNNQLFLGPRYEIHKDRIRTVEYLSSA